MKKFITTVTEEKYLVNNVNIFDICSKKSIFVKNAYGKRIRAEVIEVNENSKTRKFAISEFSNNIYGIYEIV